MVRVTGSAARAGWTAPKLNAPTPTMAASAVNVFLACTLLTPWDSFLLTFDSKLVKSVSQNLC
jgi:hypothetical protein